MDPSILPLLLGLATLLPLVSFFVILILGPRLGENGAYVATSAIVGACVLSFISFFVWVTHHPPMAVHHGDHAATSAPGDALVAAPHHDADADDHGDQEHAKSDGHAEDGHADEDHAEGSGEHQAGAHEKPSETGDYYLLGRFGDLRLTISYYIDTLTVCMFCMVTLIASCIHFYAMGYMHDELHDFTDHEVHTADGGHLVRPGRYYRFFQYLSLFCFSMLGLVLAGNIAMVFIFWELVGACSYFLIGFYVERHSASTAANKAFIVNRVGDFGMIIGLMIFWTGLGTFAFGDLPAHDEDGKVIAGKTVPGLFSKMERHHAGDHGDHDGHSGHDDHGAVTVEIPEGLMALASRSVDEEAVRAELGESATDAEVAAEVEKQTGDYAYWLMIIGGLGIFCGCVGKSAQFPLHVWLPDAMEGPTPVSALVHSATMVAAGVYLVGRFYPMFVPEVLLVIALLGTITLFMAATIAITATDIKRVLAYSTVSQLGYMMLALGVGGWVAGLMHLVTHAFFKSLLFMCSGSVIHAVHTNEMTEMGGLRKKMPITAYTMLIGCLAIAGASIPFVVGFSGYYSKDVILEQGYSFMSSNNSFWGILFFGAAAGGAGITAFYMFRMWFMTFAGTPRDEHRYDHAHESPKVMTIPLIVLAFFATTVAWTPFAITISEYDLSNLSLANLLEQARPIADVSAVGRFAAPTWPAEHLSHASEIKVPVTWLAFFTGLGGITLAAAMYGKRYLNPEEVRQTFAPVHSFLRNKWYFDELYHVLFFKPTHVVSGFIYQIDKLVIDRFLNFLAWLTRMFSTIWEQVADQTIVDGLVNKLASGIYQCGVSLKSVQTGRIRQYVMFIVVGAVALFILISFFWNPTLAN